MAKGLKAVFGLGVAALGLAMVPSAASANVCVGDCGVLGADGVVTAPPIGGQYRYVTTIGPDGGGDIPGFAVGEATNGSNFTTSAFEAQAGSTLEFYFNYVTSDGSGFSDFGWAALNGGSGSLTLFTARTTPSGDTVPGFGLPGLAPGVVLDPASTPIIPGAPVWSPLQGSSGLCFSTGCGYTGWIKSTYTIEEAGVYTLQFGAANAVDTIYDSGLAFAGLVIDGDPIDPTPGIPEPATWAMLIAGFGMVGFVARRRRSDMAVKAA
ncbi:NF038132 family protein [Sandaracinobacteroides sp. A072]|uniref:NF038132 family protein n=1 Tax=Sandaracinobacteroides sp. A072 TaxID=3461146 RepID=UPI0040418AF3